MENENIPLETRYERLKALFLRVFPDLKENAAAFKEFMSNAELRKQVAQEQERPLSPASTDDDCAA